MFGPVIKELRTKAGMSQKALATALEMSPAYVGQAERGVREIKEDRLAKFAEVFGVTTRKMKNRATRLAAAPAKVAKKNGKNGKSVAAEKKIVASAPKKRKIKVVKAD